MDSLINSFFKKLLPYEISKKTESLLKNIALILGLRNYSPPPIFRRLNGLQAKVSVIV